ncbi:MAG: 4'-phosphopantetheinyl transferase superfamily protein [Bacteroides pyogenes]|uniref:4'-phosphopantetheinyl transferase family protein n=1 Tax=Bacteroides pyogenes TaxID=310300 RepID=UPI002A90CED8|nr:4'-phosphopantetheinyl transferase superfamily protein [Bacteroides pyogenes]MDY5353442.1 4'-phosphopantetheinyl transferase superfamily protein [Bacteroides pyogenes]
MALLLEHKTEGLHWAVWRMDETPEALIALLPAACREEYGRECRSFASVQRRQEWLSVRVLLHVMCPSAGRIAYSPHGKPFLTDRSAFIGISHTKGYAAVILSPASAVGIDIERYSSRVDRVASRFLRDDEVVLPFRGETLWSRLLHWSAKETVYKCMESPDADLRKLRLSRFVPAEAGVLEVEEYATGRHQMFTVGYRLHPHFVLTWTAENDCPKRE